MTRIEKNEPSTSLDMEAFLKQIQFSLPDEFIDFYKESNGAGITSDEHYTVLWPLTDLVQLNVDYGVEEFAPDFFVFGSDGGDTAFALEKKTGNIFSIPFIGMSREEAEFMDSSFMEFIKAR